MANIFFFLSNLPCPANAEMHVAYYSPNKNLHYYFVVAAADVAVQLHNKKK